MVGGCQLHMYALWCLRCQLTDYTMTERGTCKGGLECGCSTVLLCKSSSGQTGKLMLRSEPMQTPNSGSQRLPPPNPGRPNITSAHPYPACAPPAHSQLLQKPQPCKVPGSPWGPCLPCGPPPHAPSQRL